MKAVVKHTRDGKAFFRLEDFAEPQLQNPGDVKIRITAVGVCASDVHVLHGAMQMPDGNVVGHEFSGVVEEVGRAVQGFARGDRVVCELAVGKCGRCEMCRSGHYEFCPSKRPPGWASQGVYAESIVVASDLLHKIPDGVSLEVAALAEPIAVCVYGCLERGAIAPDDAVVVFGMGSIGLLTLVAMKDSGVKNILCVAPTGRGRRRLDLAAELGASAVATPEDDLSAALERIAGRRKADCVVDCSGSPDAINKGLSLLRKDGRFVALGIAPGRTIPFDFNTGVLSALRIIFSCTSSRSSWLRTLKILQRQHAGLEKIITHRLPLAQWDKAFDALETRQAIKAVLYP
ncbi:MAG: alcohol dehydrogenase catalytic domain-containing protein [Planctomycetes bacterium]|nr:alcohol dehydrogenase catalytic domain-containing protein [Planctomycetota bacterium]